MHNKITTLLQILLFLCLSLSLFSQKDDNTFYAGIMTQYPGEEDTTIKCKVNIYDQIILFDCDNSLYLFQMGPSGYTAKSGFWDYEVILGEEEDKHLYLVTDKNNWAFAVDLARILPPDYEPKKQKRQ